MSDALFDTAFAARCRHLHILDDSDASRGFATRLFIACSPLAGLLPAQLLQHQAAAQQASHDFAHPTAMRRIVLRDGQPIGRIVIDWSRDPVLGVDIAVLPEARSSGAGTGMLRAWLDVADALQRRCALSVLRDNPAARLYARLGFAPVEDDGFSPVVAMTRLPRARSD